MATPEMLKSFGGLMALILILFVLSGGCMVFFYIVIRGFVLNKNLASAPAKPEGFNIDGWIIASVLLIGFLYSFVLVEKDPWPFNNLKETLAILVVPIIVSFLIYIFAVKCLMRKRSLFLYRDQEATSGKSILTIEPTSGISLFNLEYHVKNESGQAVLIFRRNVLESIFRKKWNCYSTDGKHLFSAVEDSFVKSLIRKLDFTGKFMPMHFYFSKDSEAYFGQYIRKFSPGDQYSYSLQFQPQVVDSWLAVAAALFLDTAEVG